MKGYNKTHKSVKNVVSQNLLLNLIKICNIYSLKIVFCCKKLNQNKQMKINIVSRKNTLPSKHMPAPSQQRNARMK